MEIVKFNTEDGISKDKITELAMQIAQPYIDGYEDPLKGHVLAKAYSQVFTQIASDSRFLAI